MRTITALLSLAFAVSAGAADFELAVSPPTTGSALLQALQREGDLSAKNAKGIQAISDNVMAKGFISGIAHTLAESQICPNASVNLYVVVRAYLEQHTARLAEPPYPLIKQALLDAFPCGK